MYDCVYLGGLARTYDHLSLLFVLCLKLLSFLDFFPNFVFHLLLPIVRVFMGLLVCQCRESLKSFPNIFELVANFQRII